VRIFTLAISSLTLAAISGGALAQDAKSSAAADKFYVGVDIGHSMMEAEFSEQFFGPNVDRHSGSDTGYGVRIGYQFLKWMSVELGYVDFGELSMTGVAYPCGLNVQGPCTYNMRATTRGPMFNVVGSWPFAKDWALHGRLGVMNAMGSMIEEDPDRPNTRRRYHDNVSALGFGLGLSYSFSEHTSVSLDYARYDQMELGLTMGGGGTVVDLGSSELASFGFRYRF
jgi:hypothetical protein